MMDWLIIGLLAMGAFSVSIILSQQFSRSDSSVYILDYPNERSLHDRPISRSGGLAILASIIIFGSLVAYYYPSWVLIGPVMGMLVVAIVSFFDDRFSVSPRYRLAAHVVASLAVIISGVFLYRLEFPGFAWELPPAAGMAISFLFVVWMINLYNFMDGMDGFAGGMSVFGFGAFAVLGWLANEYSFFAISLIITMASAGFLILNFPPARIFMGDAGSSTLGFLAAVLSLWGSQSGIFQFWIALLIFSPFLVDATVTLIRRLLQGEVLWTPHNTHYYQKLVQAGWGHRKTVLVEYAIMFGCIITGLYCVQASITAQTAALTVWALFYIISCVLVSWYFSRRKNQRL
jgi:UDP-N-acetylmuramyl pentapeptide phosphotransferase/UDP-N-acetylglucosamine-1-phosphate transferase